MYTNICINYKPLCVNKIITYFRYLKTTYNYAYSFVDPDIVIFLGDLMDEGSSATDHEFYGYVRRVFNIFLHNSESNINTKVCHIKLISFKFNEYLIFSIFGYQATMISVARVRIA